LEVVNKLQGNFVQDDLTLVETLAASAAIAVVNARLVDELRQYTAQVEARNEELDAFAHTVAHDLKGPLAYIVGFAEVLRESYPPTEKEPCRYLRTIAKKGRKMATIIDELLLLAGVRKIEDLQVSPLDMASVVAEVQERMADMVEEYQAEVIVPGSWPLVLGYGSWVEEVWVNYISNAIKYGGRPPRVELGFDESVNQQDLGRVVSESANWRISESAQTRPLADLSTRPLADSPTRRLAHSQVRFWVRDNGPGLTAEEQERLFKPFTRLHQASTKGHGLGLSIVLRIVEKLGGEVGVESVLGQGSVFSFTLPAAEAEVEVEGGAVSSGA
jgi:signal transduction histidine kinase